MLSITNILTYGRTGPIVIFNVTDNVAKIYQKHHGNPGEGRNDGDQ